VNIEHHRKDAKALVRAHRTGDAQARARAESVLGARAGERFLLSDAQHVVAVERGHRTWPELQRAANDPGAERIDETVDSGLEYRPGEPVLVRVTRRGRRYLVTDDGAAVERAGKPSGWRDAAQRAVDEDGLNLSRSGAVFVPAVAGGCPVDSLVQRVAALSLAVYQDVLELDY
jgi:hypothetical protein